MRAIGSVKLPEPDRDKFCLTSDARLWVLSGNMNDRNVLGLKSTLRRHQFAIKEIKEVPMSKLRYLYEQLDDVDVHRTQRASTESISDTQAQIIALIHDGVKRGASDLHITVSREVGTVAMRIHGDLIKVREITSEQCRDWCGTIYNAMCTQQDSNYRPDAHQDAAMSQDFVRRCGLFGARVVSSPSKEGPRMVIRLLYDNGGKVPTIEELGYLPEQIELIDMMTRYTYGINVLSGATGSGKSTTLVSVLSRLIAKERKRGEGFITNDAEEFWGLSVLTVEDPIEYQINGAVQMPLVVEKRGDEDSIRKAWTRTISAIVRSDPEVLMIGEVRDPGSARATMDAAATGHRVWTTVHVSDAIGIMGRLKGLQVEPDRLYNPEIVTGLINQSLVQRLCPHCALTWNEHAHQLDDETRLRIQSYCNTDTLRFRGPGCEHCGDNHGIIGRMVIAEIITPNLAFMNMLQNHGSSEAKRYWIEHMKGITKCQALIRRINEGLVDPVNGEAMVGPLDKDLTTLGLDYRHTGDADGPETLFAQGVLSKVQKDAQKTAHKDSSHEAILNRTQPYLQEADELVGQDNISHDMFDKTAEVSLV